MYLSIDRLQNRLLELTAVKHIAVLSDVRFIVVRWFTVDMRERNTRRPPKC